MTYGLTSFVQSMSADVVSTLSTNGYPGLATGSITLTDTQIGLGHELVFTQSAPPRIVMYPVGSEFGGRAVSSTSYLSPAGVGGGANPGTGLRRLTVTARGIGYTTATVGFSGGGGGSGAAATAILVGGCVASIALTAAGTGYTSAPNVIISGDGANASAVAVLQPSQELLAEAHQNAICSEKMIIEANCWGMTPSTDLPTTDYDFTQALYQQVIRSGYILAGGSFLPMSGVWVDSTFQSSQMARNGRAFVLRFSVAVPVLEQLYAYATPDIAGSITVTPNSTSGDAVTITA